MDKKIKGVIVSEYPFEDNSKIINIFTENGLLGVIAKGAKKVRSPFFSTTTKFNYGSFNINYKENGLSKLIDADTINSYNKSLANMGCIKEYTFRYSNRKKEDVRNENEETDHFRCLRRYGWCVRYQRICCQ